MTSEFNEPIQSLRGHDARTEGECGIMANMTTLQLVELDEPAGRSLQALDNPHSETPYSFEGPARHPLLLGSQDLIELSVQLGQENFVPVDATLVDSTLTAVDSTETDDDVAHLLESIKSGDSSRAVGFYVESMAGLYILDITMRHRDKGPTGVGSVTLSLNGVIRASSSKGNSQVIGHLQRAYRRWRQA